MKVDKQQHPRTKRRVMVRYGEAKPDKTAFTMNLSQAGAFIRTNNVIRPGKTLQLEFDFNGRKIALLAQIVWAKKVPAQLAHILVCGMGVRFIDSGPEWESFYRDWAEKKKV